MRILRLCCFILIAASDLRAVEDPLKNVGFIAFYNNDYDRALQIFQQQADKHPDNPNFQNDVAQAILYREMFRNGSLESQLVTGTNSFLRRPKMAVSPADQARFNAATARALSLSDDLLKRNARDVDALFAVAIAHGLRANFLFLVEKSWMQSLHEAIAARKADDRILQIAPNLTDAHMLYGVSEYVVGCMPTFLRMLGSVNGFHADKEDGIRQVKMVADSGTRNRFDAAILLAAIYRREHRPQDALPLLNVLATTFPGNYLFRFEQVQLYSDLGDEAAALKVLAEIEEAVRERRPGYVALPLERALYARGNLYFWYGNLQSALNDLRAVTRRPEALDLGTAGLAWLRLGQVYDLLGQRESAHAGYEEAIATVPHSDIAAEAGDYMKKPYHQKHNGKNPGAL